MTFAAQEVVAPRVKVIFNNPSERAYAERVAAAAEGALDVLVPLFGHKPPPITLRLEDTTDVYNALASPLPRSGVGLRQLFPTEAPFGYRAEDELRLLLVHELTHIMQFSYLAGRGDGLRFGLVGEGVANVPPLWLVEGLAVWTESEFTAGGRRDDALTRGLVESAVLAGTAPSLTDASLGTYSAWPGGQTRYLFGVGFTDYLIRKHGFEALKKTLALHNAGGFLRPFAGSWQLAVGTDLEAEWRAWQLEVRRKAEGRAQQVENAGRDGTPKTESGWYTRSPALSPDGRKLAWAGWPAAIMLADVGKVSSKGGKLSHERVVLENRFVEGLEWLDAHTLLYARPVRRPGRTYSDIFTLDTRTGRETQLTFGARALLPAPLPEGCILYVTDNGSRSRLEQSCPTKPLVTRWQSPVGVHLIGLATSRRGQVALSVWERGRADVALLEGGTPRYLTRDRAQDLEPSWRGEDTLLFRSDRTGAAFELYALKTRVLTPSERRLERLSESVGGAFAPEAGAGGTWFARLGGGGYNLAWLADGAPRETTIVSGPKKSLLQPSLQRSVPAPDFSVTTYNPLPSLRPYGWLPTNAGVSLAPLGGLLELSLIAQDDSLQHNLRTTLGFDSRRTALAGFYGFARYDFGGGLSLRAVPPPVRYAVQLGAWPLTPHLETSTETAVGVKTSVGARLPQDRTVLGLGLEAGLVHVLGQTSGPVLDARADGALSLGQTDTWGYRTEGWRVSATGLLSATGRAPSLGAWADGGYTLPLGGVGRLEFGVRAGYRPAWPIVLETDADFAALVSVGGVRSIPLKFRFGDGLYALERVTLEPHLYTWLDSAVHLGGDLTVSLDSALNYGATVSLSGTLGYTNALWTRFGVRLPIPGL